MNCLHFIQCSAMGFWTNKSITKTLNLTTATKHEYKKINGYPNRKQQQQQQQSTRSHTCKCRRVIITGASRRWMKMQTLPLITSAPATRTTTTKQRIIIIPTDLYVCIKNYMGILAIRKILWPHRAQNLSVSSIRVMRKPKLWESSTVEMFKGPRRCRQAKWLSQTNGRQMEVNWHSHG